MNKISMFSTIVLIATSFVAFVYHGAIQKKQDHDFVIVVASYNNKNWYRFNLNSILSQTYKNYRVLYFDDCSTDQTGALVEKYIHDHNLSNTITLIHNSCRKGALANHYRAIHMCQDHEIIVCLDGDDWFADEHVLQLLNAVYQDSSVWLTYSQFANWPTGEIGWSEEIPKDIIKQNNFRSFGFVTPQLRTYYAWLAKLVRKQDLISPKTHDFFSTAGDVALMFPMLEMAHTHFKFIDTVLCQRNVETPLNDFKVNPEEQIETTEYITSKERYKPLVN